MLKSGTLSLFCGISLDNKVLKNWIFQKMSKLKKGFIKLYCSMKKNRKIQIILDIENCFWKSEFCKLSRTRSSSHFKVICIKKIFGVEFTHLNVYFHCCVRRLSWSHTTLDTLSRHNSYQEVSKCIGKNSGKKYVFLTFAGCF